jgi:hypothetical protein
MPNMPQALDNSNFFIFPSSISWGFIALIAIGLPLLNAWLGFPIPTTPEAMYNAFGGVIPYSDASGYLEGSYQFNSYGYLNAWNMRRPINALFLAFRLKITDGNFWATIVIQVGLCIVALMFYLQTIHKYMGTRSAFISLIFFFYYAHNYVHSTLSETLGLTLGTLSFILLWNGFQNKNRMVFNAGIAALTIALCARAGPNFMIPALFLLVYFEPFTSSRLKDLTLCAASFILPLVFMIKLSTIFSGPVPGIAFSNFSYVLFGLVSGGKSWLYALQEPTVAALIQGKTEAQQTSILYAKSWEVFRNNPLLLFIGMFQYLGGFVYWFIRQFTFGSGITFYITTVVSFFIWAYLGVKIYMKRKQFQSAYLFLVIVFLGISASACITWKDGGIRPFAVAIPFVGALIGLAFGKISTRLQDLKTRENMWSVCLICFIIVSSTATPFISSFHKKIPELSNTNIQKSVDEELFLTYKPAKQPYLILENAPGLHFWTLSLNQIESRKYVYQDSTIGIELSDIASQYVNKNNALFFIYDYITKSHKLIVGALDMININSEWLVIRAVFIDKEGKTIYKAINYQELSQ